jgi:hypothetical protein
MTYALYDTETEAYLKRFNVYSDALLYMAENKDEILKFESNEAATEHLALLKAFHKKHDKSWMVDTFEVREV